jgi:transcriptional regulator with XRE-family HTH domain
MMHNYNNKEVYYYVGTRAKRRRLELGLSHKEVAEMIGVDIVELKKYEKGSDKIYGSLDRLAKYLKVSIYYFFGEIE